MTDCLQLNPKFAAAIDFLPSIPSTSRPSSSPNPTCRPISTCHTLHDRKFRANPNKTPRISYKTQNKTKNPQKNKNRKIWPQIPNPLQPVLYQHPTNYCKTPTLPKTTDAAPYSDRSAPRGYLASRSSVPDPDTSRITSPIQSRSERGASCAATATFSTALRTRRRN